MSLSPLDWAVVDLAAADTAGVGSGVAASVAVAPMAAADTSAAAGTVAAVANADEAVATGWPGMAAASARHAGKPLKITEISR